MFRLFNQIDDVSESSNISASLVNFLSSASGWFNPAKLKQQSVRKILMSSLSLLGVVSVKADAIGYVDDHGFVSLLNCVGDQSEELYFKAYGACQNLTHNLSYQLSYSLGKIWLDDQCFDVLHNTMNFGHGVFGGSACQLTGRFHTTQGPVCVFKEISQCEIDVYSKDVRNQFGTNEDVAATLGLVVSGMAVIGGVVGLGLFLSSRCKRLVPNLEQDSDSELAETRPLVAKYK